MGFLVAPMAAENVEVLKPIPAHKVTLMDGFWETRINTNREVSLPHVLKACKETGRIANFDRVAGIGEGDYEGFHFNDSDVYKLAEGLTRELARKPSDSLQLELDSLIGKIAAAQQEDGYLHPFITLTDSASRWQDPQRHELFSIGHLIEAGAVHGMLTGRPDFLEVAMRAADRVDADYDPERGPLTRPPEHQQIEIGLVRLYEATGEKKYLDLAKRLLDARGRSSGRTLMGPYSQDHQPVVAQREAVGHAVRALYQYVAMAEIVIHTRDPGYREALEQLWSEVMRGKVYVTGGLGASGRNEGFSTAFDLPNSTAYSETCAAIASIFWNERMWKLTGDGRFADVIERTLFNALLSGVSIGGDRFFYPNRLESYRGATRSEWFECACCPSNVVRFMPDVAGLVYATGGDTLHINQFINSSADVGMGKTSVRIHQQSDYPWDGEISIQVDPQVPSKFSLRIRIPDWARGAVMHGDLYQMQGETPPPSLAVNGKPVEVTLERGYVSIRREWSAGDKVRLTLPMPVRRIIARDEVIANKGRVALQRGPLVYCAEGIDQPEGSVMDLVVEDETPLAVAAQPNLLGGVRVLRGRAREVRRDADGTPQPGGTSSFTAVPYYAWAHRDATEMQVWLARNVSAARPAASPTLASQSKLGSSGGGGLGAIHDQLEPNKSSDQSVPYFHWWPKQGTTEWVDYTFAIPAQVSGCEVYWFDDEDLGGGCRIPRSWRVLYRDGDSWKPVAAREVYTTEKDRWGRVSFDPVTTPALRLEVVLPESFSTGIHEWKVE
jgi:DUF1680 family protein